MAEFCDDLDIHLYNGRRIESVRLVEILPRRFDKRWL